MNENPENTLCGFGRSFLEENRSKFYGFAYPVSDRQEIDLRLAALKKDFPDSTHIVYAFRLGSGGAQEYYTDANEPAGTAGAPTLRVLKGRSVIDALVAVIRYYGGVKLGTGGLSRAYGDTARLAVENAGIMPYTQMIYISMKIPYGAVNVIAVLIDTVGGVLVSQKFEEFVTISAKIPQTALDEVRTVVREFTRGAQDVIVQ
jgi:uncharacterized YigZ family protein